MQLDKNPNTFMSRPSSILWSKRLRVTTWNGREKGMSVRNTMDWEGMETDTRVTLWYTHKHAHTHSKGTEMWSESNTKSWWNGAMEGVIQKRGRADREGHEIKSRLKTKLDEGKNYYIATSCCSLLPCSKARDTSCSSSGREPWSSSALKHKDHNMWHQYVL